MHVPVCVPCMHACMHACTSFLSRGAGHTKFTYSRSSASYHSLTASSLLCSAPGRTLYLDTTTEIYACKSCMHAPAIFHEGQVTSKSGFHEAQPPTYHSLTASSLLRSAPGRILSFDTTAEMGSVAMPQSLAPLLILMKPSLPYSLVHELHIHVEHRLCFAW